MSRGGRNRAAGWEGGGLCCKPSPGFDTISLEGRCEEVFIPTSYLSFCSNLTRIIVSLAELDAEHSQKVLEMEHTQQMKLRERQKFFEEAFQQDMEQYLSTGYLQIERRGKCGFWRVWGWCHVHPRVGCGVKSPKIRVDASYLSCHCFCLSVVQGFS